jgi:hypothetical protein
MSLEVFVDVINKKRIFLFLFLFFICFYVFKIFYTSLPGVDVGYFLSISRDLIKDNKIPYSDIPTIYTPVGYFIYSLIYLLFEKPTIEHFYIFNLILNLISTFFIFRSLVILELKNIRVFTLIYLLVISPLIFDIKLEIFTVLFNSILIFYIAKYKKRVINLKYLVGLSLLLFLIFFSKQYGLVSILYVFIYLNQVYNQNQFKYFSIISLLVITLLIAFISVFVCFGADWNSVLFQIIGKTGLNCVAHYGNDSILNLFIGLKYYKGFPLIFLSLFCLFKNQNYSKIGLGCLIILIGLLPFFIQVFPHYYFYGFSFVFIFSVVNSFKNNIFNLGIIYILAINFYSVFVFFKTLKSVIKDKENWKEIYTQVDNLIPSENHTFLTGSQDLWFASNLKSINAKNFGYDFYSLDVLRCNFNLLDRGNYFLINQSPLDSLNSSFISKEKHSLVGQFYNPRYKRINYVYKFEK